MVCATQLSGNSIVLLDTTVDVAGKNSHHALETVVVMGMASVALKQANAYATEHGTATIARSLSAASMDRCYPMVLVEQMTTISLLFQEEFVTGWGGFVNPLFDA